MRLVKRRKMQAVTERCYGNQCPLCFYSPGNNYWPVNTNSLPCITELTNNTQHCERQVRPANQQPASMTPFRDFQQRLIHLTKDKVAGWLRAAGRRWLIDCHSRGPVAVFTRLDSPLSGDVAQRFLYNRRQHSHKLTSSATFALILTSVPIFTEKKS